MKQGSVLSSTAFFNAITADFLVLWSVYSGIGLAPALVGSVPELQELYVSTLST